MSRYDYETYWRTADWRPDPADQWFAQLTSMIPNGVTSVVDLGCGEGRFYPLFESLGISYTGMDMSPISLARARLKYPDATWVEADINHADIPSADLIFTWVTLQHVWPEEIEGVVTKMKNASKWILSGESWDDGQSWEGHCFKHDYPTLFDITTKEHLGGPVFISLAKGSV